ncbi:hypothetical protein LWI29_017597 [Acer saccharum]|uniref:Cyclin N-terminal domain-containing protein n=1 Tax=Acer saccharum TaxID=4024 RepID=A0AA39RQB3_ACESA|nr:hypothetical protein LWI29_017597 [Acer saccharum]
MEFDLENPFTSFVVEEQQQQSDTILDLFVSESDHMPSQNFTTKCLEEEMEDFHVSFRQEAVSLISQAQFSCNLEPFIPYLAVTYLDRFIFRQRIQIGKPWIVKLLVISCISLAAKMKNTHFPVSEFQGKLLKCFDTMQEMVEMEEGFDSMSMSSSTRTPVSVLDYKCSSKSSVSQRTTATTAMAAVMPPEKRETKRRKTNGFCSENRFQLSRIQQCL